MRARCTRDEVCCLATTHKQRSARSALRGRRCLTALRTPPRSITTSRRYRTAMSTVRCAAKRRPALPRAPRTTALRVAARRVRQLLRWDPVKAKTKLLADHPQGPRLRIKPAKRAPTSGGETQHKEARPGGDIVLGQLADLRKEPVIELMGSKGAAARPSPCARRPPPRAARTQGARSSTSRCSSSRVHRERATDSAPSVASQSGRSCECACECACVF